MVGFNRNEFETALAYSIRHNRYPAPDEVRKRAEELVQQVLIANGNCLAASGLNIRVTLNQPGSFFKVKITTQLCNGC